MKRKPLLAVCALCSIGMLLLAGLLDQSWLWIAAFAVLVMLGGWWLHRLAAENWEPHVQGHGRTLVLPRPPGMGGQDSRYGAGSFSPILFTQRSVRQDLPSEPALWVNENAWVGLAQRKQPPTLDTNN